MKTKLRNRELYLRLKSVFKNQVRLHKPGEAGEFTKQAYKFRGVRNYRLHRGDGAYTGEEYSVCCPFCKDTKFRLHINHMWGTADPFSGSRILWLCHCYNEECQADFTQRKTLAEMILGDTEVPFHVSTEDEAKPRKIKQLTLPGEVIRLDSLLTVTPVHPAIQWCYARGYDVRELSEVYGVGYVVVGRFEGDHATGRIIAPWYNIVNGEASLAGWTARRLVDDESGKWVHGPSPTGGVVYGLAQAVAYSTVVIVEGPGDKWAVGPAGCAILGKTLNRRKAELIATKLPAGKDTVIVVLLDPDMPITDIRAGKRHHIEIAADLLRKVTDKTVLPVYLPTGTDPGSLDREFIWKLIRGAAVKAGVNLKTFEDA